MRRVAGLGLVVAGALVLVGCSPEVERQAVPMPTPSAPSASETPAPLGAVMPAGDPTVVASGLQAPWSVLPLESGSTLVSERDTALIIELAPNGTARPVAPIGGVAPGGEGGLLGLASLEEGDTTWIYSYFTTGDDNRIVRMPLEGAPGTLTLGQPQVVLSGIPKAGNHNGGRLAFGPDGMLYATTGDAANTDTAQDPLSLGGKILRMEPDGSVPADNPIDGSLTWSYGHRNPQGLAWTESGAMYAAEFGQNTWDEVNRIEPGANYGWPTVEGIGGVEGFVDPIVQWSTDESSPSGLAAIGSTLFVAGLGGERVWMIQGADSGAPVATAVLGEYGRIRDAVTAPDGSLWFLTNNTDGRGSPRDADDHLYSVPLAPAA